MSLTVEPRYFITDVFTAKKYSGNQLATFVDCESLSSDEMLQIAKEINYSETTFITSRQEVNGGYDVRIFTPAAEVEFAGHPTLGTACILRDEIIQDTKRDSLTLNLPIGQIPVRYDRASDTYWMQQVAPTFGEEWNAERMADMLSIDSGDIDTRWPIMEVSTGFPHIIVPLRSLAALQKIKMNSARYPVDVQQSWAKIILAFSPETYASDQALAVRVFAGNYGIYEDAATGSGNGALAAYLVKQRYFKTGSIDIKTGQGYEMNRPSELFLNACNTNESIEVFVGGRVCRVAQGTWG